MVYWISNTLKKYIKTDKNALNQCLTMMWYIKFPVTIVMPHTLDKRNVNLRPESKSTSDIKKKNGSPSVITNHRLTNNPDFNVQLLDNPAI